MVEKSNNEIFNNDFEHIIASYSDEELRKVLKSNEKIVDRLEYMLKYQNEKKMPAEEEE